MDEDAEVEGQLAQTGPKGSGSIPAGAMLASPGDQTIRKMSLEPLSEAKSVGQEGPLVPARSGDITHLMPLFACPVLFGLLVICIHVP